MKINYRFIFFLLATVSLQDGFSQTKPNIIYILADDLGYGDIGCYGQTVIRTPHLDSMASRGMRFTRHYAGAPVCAPSRAVLMTGRDIGHARVRGNLENGPHGFGAGLELRDEDVTVAEVLKQRGYATAIIGKWGLGVEGTTGEPKKQGFDYSYGYLNQGHAHTQFPGFLFRNGERINIPENASNKKGGYSNDLFTKEALRFIAGNKKRPFFLYLAYTTPHAELLVPDDSIFNSYKGKFEEKPFVRPANQRPSSNGFGGYNSQAYPKAAYAASITHMDMCIGKIISILESNNMLKNTLIIFSSDNGPAKEGGADPDYFKSSGLLRGKKRDLYEGGIRVPMIAMWPAVIKPHSESTHISGFQDVLPTLAEISGERLGSEQATEGISFYATLKGSAATQTRHAYMYWEFHENKTSEQAIMIGNWKGIRHAPDEPFELYDLDNDEGEQKNVAADHPGEVLKLEAIIKDARESHPVWPLKRTIQ